MVLQRNKFSTKLFMLEALRSGSIAAIAMIPFALLFSALGMRINEFGRKVIQLLFSDFSPGIQFALFVIEHFVLSWFFAIPLLLLLKFFRRRISYLFLGIVYGAIFYILINSLLLPALFSQSTPWKLGFTKTILPSLVVHIVYGLSVAISSRRFIKENRSKSI